MKVIDRATTRMKELFGWSDEQPEYDMTWEEAMQSAIIFHVHLESGGRINIKMNHDNPQTPILGRTEVY